jgi:hypothetical protein
MGLVRGYGLELLVGIIKLARPTVPIQIQHTRPETKKSMRKYQKQIKNLGGRQMELDDKF